MSMGGEASETSAGGSGGGNYATAMAILEEGFVVWMAGGRG